MKVQIFSIILFIFPVSAIAHDFWIGTKEQKIFICGGHNFPVCEFAPSSKIVATVWLPQKPEKKLLLKRIGNTLEGKLSEKGPIAFNFKRGNKIVYCGLAINLQANLKMNLKNLCGVEGELSISSTRDALFITIPGYAIPATLKRKNTKDIYIYPEKGRFVLKHEKQDALLLLLLEGHLPLSIHINTDVK